MKKWIAAALLLMLCVFAVSANASQMLNIYMDKDALLAHNISAADIRIRPEGMVRVTRHSLWPWDEEGTKWSLFVEIENTSDETIVIDETWLVACKGNRDEIATADYVFGATDNVLDPGERVVLHAGVDVWMMPTDYHDVTEFEAVEGLSEFAGKIRRAEILRVRLDTRGNESFADWPTVEIEPKIWIDGRTVYFEWTNETGEHQDFRTIGAVVCDGEGRMIDVIYSTHSRQAVVAPGGTFTIMKELAPYVTQEMISGATFEAFAFAYPNSP